MNPLSITASTLTVIQAVGVVTIGVGTFVHALRTIDSRLAGLDDELSDLQRNLKMIEDTLIGCKDIDLSLIDDAIWHQSKIAIGNCQATVNDLARVVEKIKEASKPGTIGWKVQAIFELKVHERDLAGFRDKVHQSNSALQTMLHIIVVSLSLRQNASQAQILNELNNLKQSINNTWNVSSKSTRDLRDPMSKDRPRHNITRDLRYLAAAAESFYVTASSTAGTLKSDDGKSVLNSVVDSEASGAGDLPCLRYQLLEQYLHNLHSGHPPSVSSYPSRTRTVDKRSFKSQFIVEGPTVLETANNDTNTEIKHRLHHPDSSTFDIQKEDGDDHYFEDVVLAGMRELAIESIKALDFDEAIRLIKEVVCDGFEAKTRNFDYFETFSQLILCYFFQGEWRLAEPLINLLSKSNERMPDPSHELIIYNFSHALSLCCLAEYSFERAFEYCKQALCGKRRLYKAGQTDRSDYEETLGLYATIYEVSGDCIRAEIFRRQLLAEFIYIHPENVVDFFQSHENLLTSIIGSDDIQTLTGALLTSAAELAATPTDATHGGVPAKKSNGNILRMKLTRYEVLERDTAKEAVVDTFRSPYEADDELSPQERLQHIPKARKGSRRSGGISLGSSSQRAPAWTH
uniref:Azaphilone pigments biosynthesis cluster protein L N-terminal domain-containing protein n=1 Tax=Bionectria ochroleuca TaxID=29856 RepID=A0A8H7NCG3_BIOOC